MLKILVIFALGTVLGFNYARKIDNKKITDISNFRPLLANQSDFKLIQPLLTYRIPKSLAADAYAKFFGLISAEVKKGEASGELINASVYFRDLKQGRWTGINEQDKYEPASLLKVVIMISYFKQAENNPKLFSEEFSYTQAIKDASDIPFGSVSNLEVGKKYMVQELINNMIINSDNGAMNLLLDSGNPEALQQFYSLINIQNPDTQPGSYTISTQTYSIFFRILFNATYLNYDYSEKALELLSQVKFTEGLADGLPEGVSIAHKFGEHVVGENGQAKEVGLHDCGIVYYPDHPYLLCVMTRGKNRAYLTEFIKTISRLAYQDTQERYK